ncbi:cholecystokinin receptor type A-like [Littorina saxatilis]|uniref:G-protein coupled receptors family 1 profile domain-containing protein n=1 Tax=Littorina saxatilis TaxID=31220 RepID=A0AAN9ARC9_9CAEN
MLESSPGTSRSSNDDVTTASTTQALDSYNVNEFLNQKNAEFVSNSVPTIVFLVVSMILGIVGNTLVFIVYYKRFKPSVTRTCILAMSVCDVFISFFAIPLQLVVIYFDATFYSVWACKMSSSITIALVLLSAILLVAVSVERQKVVCSTRHSINLSLKPGYTCVLFCGVASIVLAWPYGVLTGKYTRRFPDSNITGSQCSISDEYRSSASIIVYKVMLLLVYALCLVIMSVSYWRIVRHLWQHKKIMATFTSARETPRRNNCWVYFKKHQSKRDVKNEFQEQKSDNYADSVSVSYVKERRAQHRLTIDEEQATTSIATSATSPSRPASNTTKQLQTGKKSEVRGRAKDIPSRTTLMMFVLTVLYVLTYLPYLVITIREAVTSEESLRTFDMNLRMIGLRLYYINCCVNFFVYYFFSLKFRHECRQLVWDK